MDHVPGCISRLNLANGYSAAAKVLNDAAGDASDETPRPTHFAKDD